MKQLFLVVAFSTIFSGLIADEATEKRGKKRVCYENVVDEFEREAPRISTPIRQDILRRVEASAARF